jgi:ribonuclease P protein component
MKKSRGFISKCLLRKKDRIKSNLEIKEIIHNGIKIVCHEIDYFFKPNKKYRMAVIVKKGENNAVERNKIKRRIREIYRKDIYKSEFDLVIKIKKNIFKKKYYELENEIIENIDKNMENEKEGI